MVPPADRVRGGARAGRAWCAVSAEAARVARGWSCVLMLTARPRCRVARCMLRRRLQVLCENARDYG